MKNKYEPKWRNLIRFSEEKTFIENKKVLLNLLESYSVESSAEFEIFFANEVKPFDGVVSQTDSKLGFDIYPYYDALICSAIIAAAKFGKLDALDHLRRLEPNLIKFAKHIEEFSLIAINTRLSWDDLYVPVYRDGGRVNKYLDLVTEPDLSPSTSENQAVKDYFERFLATKPNLSRPVGVSEAEARVGLGVFGVPQAPQALEEISFCCIS